MYITVACQKEQIYFLNNINALKKKKSLLDIHKYASYCQKKRCHKEIIILKNASKQMSPNIKR